MFFALSKTLGFFALPSNLVIVVGLIGVLLLLTRFKRTARVLMVASILLTAILALSPLGNALIIPLEDRFPQWNGSGDVAGIILLGGAVTPDVSAARDDLSLNEAAERLTTVARLASTYPRAKIILSGGDAGLVRAEGAEAPRTVHAIRSKTPYSPRSLPRRKRASAGCSSPPLIICHARSASSAAPASRSRPIRSTGARAGPPMRCGFSSRSGMD
jgi:uncharacterized SAM-binding protein YcdF (DUF218 family)